MACLGISAGEAPITFRTPHREAFEDWLEDSFRILLAPHALQTALWTQKGMVREIVDLDSRLHLASEEECKASHEAGATILVDRKGMEKAAILAKLSQAIHRGSTPGHHATLFAVQAALNHLPHQAILLGLAYDEWRRCMQSPGLQAFLPFLPQASQIVGELLQPSQSAFRIA